MQQLLTAFANAKATHISFSKNITTFAIFNDQSFNDMSTKDIKLSINGIELIKASFVCLFVLRFYSPINTMGSCRAWSVYLSTRLLGSIS